jgi:iron complex outermembrane recepter protein
MWKFITGGLAAAALCATAWAQPAGETHDHEQETPENEAATTVLEPVVVTAVAMRDPFTIVTDPRQPRLPLPAADGGAFLKSIPGFTVSRKGGTSGDPALRGLGGSRLNILLDDAQILGGCGMRMDPPTAYVFPEAYDRIEVIKGPQSVRYGATIAGIVHFDREPMRFTESTTTGFGSMTVGSFERQDFVGDITTGDRLGYVRLIGNVSSQDDYDDGAGRQVHSQYERWSTTAILGWTPDEFTHLEFSVDRSDAEAAYDDRGMDGVIFDRTGYTLSLERTDLAPWLANIEALVFYNYVDHVMDNYTLRAPPMQPMVSYPDRRTIGARLAAELALPGMVDGVAGVDWADNRHRSNQLMGTPAFGYRDVPREDNAEFTDAGVFLELERPVSERTRVFAGLRSDYRESTALDGIYFGGAEPGTSESGNQQSGFLRVSHELADRPATLYAGLGRAERAPDFWELRREFDLRTEKLTQLDLGASLRTRRVTANLALFAGQIDDYILVVRPGLEASEARNVDATTHGAEADLTVQLVTGLSMTATGAWVRSDNDTDDVPLAQTPPLEGTLSVDHEAGRMFSGLLFRAVSRQDRIHPGYGTIYSLDTDETPGFATWSVYGGWRAGKRLTATAGIDNLFDRSYAEHIQRGSADLGASMRRIFEPGRTLWLRLSTEF